MIINLYSKKLFKIFSLPILLYLNFFDTTIFNSEIKSEKKYSFFDENPKYKERGEMQAFIKGHQLIREKFYLSDIDGISNIKQVDEHEMIFESSYEDWYILEHTRLVDEDNYRFRVIYSWNKNKLKIVENHHEIKIIK